MTTTSPIGPEPVPVTPLGTTLVECFLRNVEVRREEPAMFSRSGTRWVPITWGTVGAHAQHVSAFLVGEKIAAGSKVALWSSNRPEWHIADAGILSAHCVSVPLYLTTNDDDVCDMLKHTEVRVLFVDSLERLRRAVRLRHKLHRLRHIVVIGEGGSATDDPHVVSWHDALRRGESFLETHRADVVARAAAVVLDDVATIIPTGGTTGAAKAVVMTYRNIDAVTAGLSMLFDALPNDRVMSYLPIAHISERLVSEFHHFYFGNPVYFVGEADDLLLCLRDVRPTLFFGTPAVFTHLAGVARDRMRARRGPIQRIAKRWFLARVRATLGLDKVRIVAGGATPFSQWLLEWYHSIGIDICEAYGQTEGGGIATMNRSGDVHAGTVGRPIPGVEVKISETGEILLRGAGISSGYYKDVAATRATFTAGWLHTGDSGSIDERGCLHITDRRKDRIVTADGDTIVPAPIEAALKKSPLIDQVVLVGNRRPFVAALVTLNQKEVGHFLGRDDVVGRSRVMNPRVRRELQTHITTVNAQLAPEERVRKWVAVNTLATGDELTWALAVRRDAAASVYEPIIEKLYRQPGLTARK